MKNCRIYILMMIESKIEQNRNEQKNREQNLKFSVCYLFLTFSLSISLSFDVDKIFFYFKTHIYIEDTKKENESIENSYMHLQQQKCQFMKIENLFILYFFLCVCYIYIYTTIPTTEKIEWQDKKNIIIIQKVKTRFFSLPLFC